LLNNKNITFFLNARDKEKNTPLLLGLKKDLDELALTLIKKGADILPKNVQNETALSLSIYHYKPEILKLLLKHESLTPAHLNVINDYGETYLIYLCRTIKKNPVSVVQMIRLLLDVEGTKSCTTCTRFNKTPLMYLAQYTSDENDVNSLLKPLIEHSLNENNAILLHKDGSGETILDSAIENGNTALVKLLMVNYSKYICDNDHSEYCIDGDSLYESIENDKNDDEGEICCICHEDLLTVSDYKNILERQEQYNCVNCLNTKEVTLPCGHTFHSECIIEQFQRNPHDGARCPICRKNPYMKSAIPARTPRAQRRRVSTHRIHGRRRIRRRLNDDY